MLARARVDVPGPVQAFLDHGEDFLQAPTLDELVAKMNRLTGEDLLDPAQVAEVLEARDSAVANRFGKDGQISAITSARNYVGDKLVRSVKPHRLTDPKAGPLVAVRLRILTRKSLGGIQTDLDSRVLDEAGEPIPGLYAAGEAAGFGGGGMPRLPRAGGHVPWRVPLQRQGGRTACRRGQRPDIARATNCPTLLGVREVRGSMGDGTVSA